MDLAASYDNHRADGRASAADAAAMLAAIAGYDPNDPTSLPAPVPDYIASLTGVYGARGLKIGIDGISSRTAPDPDMIAMIETGCRRVGGARRRAQADPLPGYRRTLSSISSKQ